MPCTGRVQCRPTRTHYADRKNGRERVDYGLFTDDAQESALIKEVLGSTYDLTVYQEQSMILGQKVAGFDAKLTNRLRKAISKKTEAEFPELGELFIAGARSKVTMEGEPKLAFSASTAERLWDSIKGSAAYAFDKAHSAAYGYVGYLTAWLKANYAAAFDAGMLSVTKNDDKRHATLRSLEAEGVTVHAPEVNTALASTAAVDDTTIVLGLREIKGVGSVVAQIIAEREALGLVTSSADLLARVGDLNVDQLANLAEAGALDEFGELTGQNSLTDPGMCGQSDRSPRRDDEEQPGGSCPGGRRSGRQGAAATTVLGSRSTCRGTGACSMGTPTITVFGRFEITADPRPMSLAGGLQRMLLALLAGSQGRWVPGAVLAEALWPGAPPGAAMSRLHVHVHRLRTRLGPGAVEAGPDGYRLHLAADGVDAWRFDRIAGGTLAAHTDGGDELALLARLDDAAACWGGEPYPGVDHPLVDAERHRLTELYLLVEETRAQHRLDRGEHRELLEHLIPAACAHATRERLHTLWMTALYRCGDHAEALRVHGNVRAALAAELGTTPGPAIQAIHALVLDALEDSDSAEAGDGETGAGGPIPGSTPPPAPSDQEQQVRAQLARTECPDRLALLRRQLGMLLGSAGRTQESLDLLFQAEARYRLHGPVRAHRAVLQQLAMEMSKVGDLRRAVRLLDEAQQTYPDGRSSDRLQIVRAIVLTHMKDAAGADAALARSRAPGPNDDPVLAAMWWRARSIVARLRGRQEDAIAAARISLQLAQRATAPALEGVVMVDLACALRDAGLPEAQRWYREAVRLGKRYGRAPLIALAEASSAKAALLAGNPARATVHAREALRHARQAGAWGLAGRASARLADAAEELGETMRAGWYRQESISQYRRVDYPLTGHAAPMGRSLGTWDAANTPPASPRPPSDHRGTNRRSVAAR